jgi:hypothetical protein
VTRRAGAYDAAFWILLDLMQRVQTLMRLTAPLTVARTD